MHSFKPFSVKSNAIDGHPSSPRPARFLVASVDTQRKSELQRQIQVRARDKETSPLVVVYTSYCTVCPCIFYYRKLSRALWFTNSSTRSMKNRTRLFVETTTLWDKRRYMYCVEYKSPNRSCSYLWICVSWWFFSLYCRMIWARCWEAGGQSNQT